MIFESIKMVLKIFKTNKLRTMLTMIGMIIGILSVVIIMSISDAAKKTISKNLESLNNSTIRVSFIQDESNNIMSTIPEKLIDKLNSENSIEYISKRIEFEWKELEELKENTNKEINDYFNEEDFYEDISICEGVSINYFDIYSELKEMLLEGRLFNKIDEQSNIPICIIREDIARLLTGSNQCIGEKILVNNQEMKIIGVLQNEETEYSYTNVSDIYVLAEYLTNCNETINFNIIEYIVKPISTNAREEAKEKIKEILNEYISKDNYFIDEYYISSEDVSNEILDLITIVFIAIASISLLVGGIGIMNILLVSVNERIKEIGIRRAVGATKSNIIIQFLIEAMVITIMSGIISIILAIIFINILNNFLISYDLSLKINFEIIVKVIWTCGIIGVTFGTYPSIKASSLNPVDALRYE